MKDDEQETFSAFAQSRQGIGLACFLSLYLVLSLTFFSGFDFPKIYGDLSGLFHGFTNDQLIASIDVAGVIAIFMAFGSLLRGAMDIIASLFVLAIGSVILLRAQAAVLVQIFVCVMLTIVVVYWLDAAEVLSDILDWLKIFKGEDT